MCVIIKTFKIDFYIYQIAFFFLPLLNRKPLWVIPVSAHLIWQNTYTHSLPFALRNGVEGTSLLLTVTCSIFPSEPHDKGPK